MNTAESSVTNRKAISAQSAKESARGLKRFNCFALSILVNYKRGTLNRNSSVTIKKNTVLCMVSMIYLSAFKYSGNMHSMIAT